ncbi:MAG TPA: cytochrome c oxidase accessory protein CcoG [Pseudomonadales bacterium]|nr:cytochrome c oxidase accessory protein CcoG [Pseudomonadales bacterium]
MGAFPPESEQIAVRHVDLYASAPKIQVRAVDGFFSRLRTRLRWILVIGTLLGPWLTWDGRQALLLDLPARQFHLFGLTFFPQDFILVSGLLIVGAFALFTATNWLGRVWCGYACPQSVWFQLFIDIEGWIEGPRHRRIRQDAGPRSARLVAMKTAKWAAWLLVALVTGLSIVGYFVPVRTLVHELATFSLDGWALFWVGFFTTATLVMGALLREQVCKYMCPYARFQAAMFDQDTLIVSYDPRRGEPRGSRSRGADPQALGLGDCIDCELCVQVCPVGIDIRDGLQYECISCAHCIDACDGIMDRMGYAPGLISYTTEHRLQGQPTRILRTRLVAYGLVLLLMVAAFGFLAAQRAPAELDVLRDRGALYREVYVDGQPWTENTYSLRIVNKTQDTRVWSLAVTGLPGAELIGPAEVELAPGEVRELPVRLRARPGTGPSTTIRFVLGAAEGGDEGVVAAEESRFMAGDTP